MIFVLFIYLFHKVNVVSTKPEGVLKCRYYLKHLKMEEMGGGLVASGMKAERMKLFSYWLQFFLSLFYCKHKDNLILIQHIHTFTRK